MTGDLGDYWSDELVAGLKRDPEAVLRDVNEGTLTAGEAKSLCGVVFHGQRGDADFGVDAAATELLRMQIRVAGAAPGGA